jgi:cystathionine gamma-lyase
MVRKSTKSTPRKPTKKVAKKIAKSSPKKKVSKASPQKAQSKGQASKQKKMDIFDHFAKNKKYEKCGFATRAIHAGNEPEPVWGGVAPAIDLSTTFAQAAPGDCTLFDYQRCGNPTRLQLEKNLASLEHGKYAFATQSGMSAAVQIISMFKAGDHILCVDDVYGGTSRYLRRIIVERGNLELTMADITQEKDLRKAIKKNTKLVWIETPSNPTLKIFDIAMCAKVCREKGVLLSVDNTFMSPVLQNPLLLGADMVTHSISKYIGGHSDVIGGCIVLNNKDLYERLKFNMMTLGTGQSPFDCFLALRGSKTLDVRVHRAQENAVVIAKLLESHKKIAKTVYPGLKSHPQYALQKKQAKGPGAMISFYVKGDINMADRFLRALKIITLAESLGGVESLIENPALMTHGSVPAATRKELGIEDNFIRLSVGIESIEDLVNDVKQALEKA